MTLQAKSMMENFEGYFEKHPEVAVIDRLPNVRKLLDRSLSYSVINNSDLGKIGMNKLPFVIRRISLVWFVQMFSPPPTLN